MPREWWRRTRSRSRRRWPVAPSTVNVHGLCGCRGGDDGEHCSSDSAEESGSAHANPRRTERALGASHMARAFGTDQPDPDGRPGRRVGRADAADVRSPDRPEHPVRGQRSARRFAAYERVDGGLVAGAAALGRCVKIITRSVCEVRAAQGWDDVPMRASAPVDGRDRPRLEALRVAWSPNSVRRSWRPKGVVARSNSPGPIRSSSR